MSGAAVAEALARLEVDELALAIHDASLPMTPEEDVGRGAPAADGALAFLAEMRALGFRSLQLGPQGETSAGNPSPYDAAAFSRDVLSLAWAPLVRGDHGPRLLEPEALAARVAKRPAGADRRVPHAHVHAVQHELLSHVHERLRALRAAARAGRLGRAEAEALRALEARLGGFARRHAAWLERYELHDALGALHGCDHTSGWPAADRRLFAPDAAADPAVRRRTALRTAHGGRIERYRLGQLLAHEQHEAVRAQAHALGLRLRADLQIGFSDRDRWSWPEAFLPGYRLGAPPSRTNPEGQPWGYPVLDPAAYRIFGRDGVARPGPALRLFLLRIDKLFAEFDGVRIDHPHGLVDPWIYRADDPDPLHAIRHGARLFSSPALPDHPELARFAIARPADLDPDPDALRWADGWVRRLTPEQVDRYALLFDALLARAPRRGPADVACEVLSTLPLPVARVLARHGLGRFRVTQKADLADPHDVYRSENARPEDWIMVGTHDTPPIWRLVDAWQRDGSAVARARRLAERLAPPAERTAVAEALARDPGLLAHAHVAELFASRARHVMIFFTDLFGFDEVYNAPGTVSESNWSLRLPATWRREYGGRLLGGRAISLPRALLLALRATGAADPGLVARLEAEAAALPRRLLA